MATASNAAPYGFSAGAGAPPPVFLPEGSTAGPSGSGSASAGWTPAGAQLPAKASPTASRSLVEPRDGGDGLLSPLTRPLSRAYNAFERLRADLDLPYPGLAERISHEALQTFTTNHLFDGVRFDLAKGASINPMFHVSHNFHLGATQAPMGTYSFSTMYGTDEVFATGNIDDQGSLSARLNRRWGPNQTTKISTQLSKGFGQSMFTAEHCISGRDHSIALKSINANPADGTGMFLASYLQSVTKSLALGLEAVYARQPGAAEDVTTTYMLRYLGGVGLSGDKPEWIASANLVTQGVLQASYWHRLSDRVDAAAELTVLNMPSKREAEAKIGAKWDFRLATLRAQLDNFGRLTSVYEARLFPSFSLTFAAELDHLRSTAKFGFGVSIETPMTGEDPTAPQPAMPSPPFY